MENNLQTFKEKKLAEFEKRFCEEMDLLKSFEEYHGNQKQFISDLIDEIDRAIPYEHIKLEDSDNDSKLMSMGHNLCRQDLINNLTK